MADVASNSVLLQLARMAARFAPFSAHGLAGRLKGGAPISVQHVHLSREAMSTRAARR